MYRQDYQTVYKCCPGWSQLNGEAGCLYRKCLLSSHWILFCSSGIHPWVAVSLCLPLWALHVLESLFIPRLDQFLYGKRRALFYFSIKPHLLVLKIQSFIPQTSFTRWATCCLIKSTRSKPLCTLSLPISPSPLFLSFFPPLHICLEENLLKHVE